jgi:trans-2,3-dihydro-3-hydroxyanthranilate isomerase
MRRYRYRIVNVFAETLLSGNALCVFEDAAGLGADEMQAIALQFNLSETTFLFDSALASARVRIFTPSFEMPFAGHPTLGSAHVVHALASSGSAVAAANTATTLTLEMKAGLIAVTSSGDDVWTLEARAPRTRSVNASPGEIAAMLGLAERDLSLPPLWVDTGTEQLVVPLTSPEAVTRCAPDPRLLARHGACEGREGIAYVWAYLAADRVQVRFFFLKRGALCEDPGTGSACANLGGWLIAQGEALPVELSVQQGEQTGRPCQLALRVDAERRIFVTGKVMELGRGEIQL